MRGAGDVRKREKTFKFNKKGAQFIYRGVFFRKKKGDGATRSGAVRKAFPGWEDDNKGFAAVEKKKRSPAPERHHTRKPLYVSENKPSRFSTQSEKGLKNVRRGCRLSAGSELQSRKWKSPVVGGLAEFQKLIRPGILAWAMNHREQWDEEDRKRL